MRAFLIAQAIATLAWCDHLERCCGAVKLVNSLRQENRIERHRLPRSQVDLSPVPNARLEDIPEGLRQQHATGIIADILHPASPLARDREYYREACRSVPPCHKVTVPVDISHRYFV